MIVNAKVLVVEDEEIVSLFIRNELEDAGFGVELRTLRKPFDGPELVGALAALGVRPAEMRTDSRI